MPAWLSNLWNSAQSPTATTTAWDWSPSTTSTTTIAVPIWIVGTGTTWSWSNTSETAATTLGSAQAMAYQQQTAMAAYRAQNAAERYQFALTRPLGLGSLFSPSRPAIITHQDEARRDRELYRRAMQEHDEQEIARLRRIVERHEQTEAEQRLAAEAMLQQRMEHEQQREAAKLRARELLFEHLTPEQRDTFDRNGWFVVEGGRSKTQYRIRAAEHMAGNVDVLTAANRVAHRLCAHIRLGTVPLGDQLLAQKVMLELAEDDFLRIANRHAA